MSAPFAADALAPGASLALATLIGIGFGFVLERAGFGSSRRLAAQFYLYDMTVFKVMFTAIVTAMVGLFGFSRIGWVRLDLVWINPTYLWPQIAGGLLLGAGFIISGYCPGTSLVASASGKIDGILALAGVATGGILFAAAYTPAVQAFHHSGFLGRLLLSDLLSLDPVLLAAAIAFMAGLAFIGAEALERRFAARAGAGRGPRFRPALRNTVSAALVATAIVFFIVPRPRAGDAVAGSPAVEVSALELARSLVEGRGEWTVVDLRSPDAFAKDAIPGSQNATLESLADPAAWSDRFPAATAVLLVDEDGLRAASVRAPSTHHACVLRGGYAAWRREMLVSPPAPRSAAKEALADYRERAALSAYFSGAAAAPPPAAAAPAPVKAGTRKKAGGGGC